MDPTRECALRFGTFELDLVAHELRRNGARVHLTQQTFCALALLAARPGRLVTRGELRQALWPDGTHVEFERGINFCINQLRSALGDDARAPRFIETVPRVGYRFVAEVRPAEASVVAAPPARPNHLALAVALALLALGGAGWRPHSPAVPRNLDPFARDAYLRGTLLMRASDPAAWLEAVRSFERGLALEPRHAAAQTALARALLTLSESGATPARDAMPRARAAALAALREDPTLADAWVSLAAVRLYYDWDWSLASRDLDRALDLDPGAARAHDARAALLSASGDHAGAIAEAERATSLDPLCPVLRGNVGWYYYCARRFSEAAASWRRSVAIAGDDGPRDRLVDALRQLGRTDDAWREARETMLHAGVSAGRADALEQRGADAALRGFLAGSVSFIAGRGGPPERLAALNAAIGEREHAIAWLERAADERSPGLVRSLAVDPDFDALRSDPRYRHLLGRVGLSRIPAVPLTTS